LCASLLGWAVFRVAEMLPEPLRARALLGTAEAIIDLAVAVDPERDHVRGDRAYVPGCCARADGGAGRIAGRASAGRTGSPP
jgi:hypothetical protein